MKSLSIGQHFPHYESMELIFHHSRASNSKVNIPIWPKFKLRQDFMPVLVTCKLDEDPIKIEGTIDRTRSNMGFFWHSRAGINSHSRAGINSKVNSLFWPDF